MTTRREFVLCVGASALVSALPSLATAQQRKVPRVGVLLGSPLDAPHPGVGLQDGLRELGYVEGQNIRLEWRSARGDVAQFPKLAAELVQLEVDVIVAGTSPAIQAAQSATRSIPIVMGIATDPVAARFVASLSRPGGNTTGVSVQSDEIAAKRIQLLKEAFPKMSLLAVLWAPTSSASVESAKTFERAGHALGLNVLPMEIRGLNDFDRIFGETKRLRIAAAVLSGNALFFAHRARIADLAVSHRLPMIASAREYVEAGLLMSYGANFKDAYRQAASYVDRILKGAKPADLPVEQPRKFELIVNRKTAKALGVKLPNALLARAEEVIE